MPHLRPASKTVPLLLLLCAATAGSARATTPPGEPAPPAVLAAVADAPPVLAPAIEWKKPITYSLGMMGVGIVGLVALGEADDTPGWSNFTDAFEGGPRLDDDGPLYNWVLHPLWGSETYLRAREAHMGMLGSFGFSLGASVVWEYLIESWTEHPSTQDLVLTTGLGWMLGELRWRMKQRHGDEAPWWLDPLHDGMARLRVRLGRSDQGAVEPTLRLAFRF